MGWVALLHYYPCVTDMLIPEVNPHGSPRRFPATTPLNWAVPHPRLCKKRHPVSPGLVAPTFPFALLSRNPPFHSMMGLAFLSQLPLAKSFLNSGQMNRSLCLSLYLLPAPTIRRV